MRKRYRRKAHQEVSAVRLALEFDGHQYSKCGDLQRAEPDDWLVDNKGDVYTVSAASFERTYEPTSPVRWKKTASVWAEQTR